MLDSSNAVLCIVDYQEKLLPKIAGAEAILARGIRLIRFAREMDLPILLSEQYPKGLGRTVEGVREAIGDIAAIEKLSFGCLGSAEYRNALEATNRKQMLLAGVETHVCVLQTALAALESHYEVYLAADASGTRHVFDHDIALRRLEREGATLVTAETAMFELLREAGTPQFERVLPIMK